MLRGLPNLLIAAAVTGLLVPAACSNSTSPGSATTVPTTSTSPPTTAPTTTLWAPTAPQASPDAAAARLLSAWGAGNRGLAASVAAPAAVGVLFSQPYPAGYLQNRGCTSGANPATCTYRNTRTNGIYEVEVSSGASGWYVTAVTAEA